MRKISQIPGQMSLDLFGVEAKEPEEKLEKKIRKSKVVEEKESQTTPKPSPKEEEKPVRKKRAKKKAEEDAESEEKTVVRKKRTTKKEEESPTIPKPNPSKTKAKTSGKASGKDKGMYGNAVEIANEEGAISIGKLVNRFRISATSAIAIFEKLKEEGIVGENGRAEKKGKGSWKI